MYEYDDGTKVEIDENKLLIRVHGAQHNRNFEIFGFQSLSDIKLFLNFGDFTPGVENDYYMVAEKKTGLHWAYYD